MREEVIGCRVLVHSTNEVGDGIEEVFLLHHRCVKDNVVAQLLLCTPYVVGHALEHLEAEAILRGLIHLCEEVGIRDGEQVV